MSPEELQAIMDADASYKPRGMGAPKGVPSPGELQAMMDADTSYKPSGKASDVGGVMNQVGQGMLGGFGDEIGAGLDALYNTGSDLVAGRNQNISIGQQYDAALQGRRDAEKDFKSQSPWLAGGAGLVGALGSPLNLMIPGGGGIMGAAKAGARLGAVSGIGESEGGAENRLIGGAKGGAMGGAAGGVIGAASAALGGLGRRMRSSGDNMKAAGIGATKTDFKMSQRYGGLIPNGEGGKTTKLMSQVQSVIDDGTFKGVSKNSTEDMIFANSDKIAKYEKNLSNTIASADEMAVQKGLAIEPEFRNAEEFAYKANPLERDAIIREYKDGIAAVGKLLNGTLGKMQEVKKDLYRATYTDSGAVKGELAAKIAQDLKESIERGVIAVTGKSDLSKGVKALNAGMGKHIEVEKLLARRFAQEQGSDPVKNLMGSLRTSGGNMTTPTLIGKATGGEQGGKMGFLAGVALNMLNTPGGKMIGGQALKSASPWLAGAGSLIGKGAKPGALLAGKFGAQEETQQEQQPMDSGEPVKPVTARPKTTEIHSMVDKIAGSPELANIAKAVMKVESNGDPRAQSGAGAQGLMQIMPAMQKSLGVKDPFDPEDNIKGGVALLKEEIKRFGGSLELALAAYNAGSPKVKAAIAKAGSMDWDEVSRFLPEETRKYVPKVKQYIEV